MQDCDELSLVLAPALTNQSCIKVGLELSSDLRKLANSYAHMDAFRHVRSCLDLKQLWSAHKGAQGSSLTKAGRRAVGLSFLAEQLLGKPLDKAMQV